MINTQVLKGNLIRQDYTTAFVLNQGDKGVPFKIELLENGSPYILQNTDIVAIEWYKPNGNPFLQDTGITKGDTYIEITTPEAISQSSGSGTFNVIISDGTTRKGTIRREYKVIPTSMRPGATSEDTITDAITELRNLNTEIASTVQNNQELINNNTAATKSDINSINSSLEEKANKSDIGSPLIANTIAEMVDITKVYVYTGSETGYTNGNWYSYNGTSWVSGGVYNSQGIGDGTITPVKASFYHRESSNLYDISTLDMNYCYNVATVENGVITTKSLGVNAVFYLNLNATDNVGKGTQSLSAGTYYLKYKAKSTSGETASGSGTYPPRIYGDDAVRHDFTKVSGANSTDFTEWVWAVTLDSDINNYGFLFQNGSFAETYTFTDVMLTTDSGSEYEAYETYYSDDNIKNKKYEGYKTSIQKNTNSIQNIEEKLLAIEHPKVLHCGFIGDSLTEGDYGSLDGTINKKDLNYPYYFKQLTGWTGTNFGKCGFTTTMVWDSIVSKMDLGIKYNIFIIMLGTNGGLTDTIDTDCTGDDYNNYATTQTGSYCKIVEHIMTNCPTAQIFLCTPPYNNKTVKCEYIADTGNVVKKIAKKYHIQVIDVYSELGVNSLNESIFLPIDRLHFGQYGYQKLGVFLASKIKSNLSYYDI